MNHKKKLLYILLLSSLLIRIIDIDYGGYSHDEQEYVAVTNSLKTNWAYPEMSPGLGPYAGQPWNFLYIYAILSYILPFRIISALCGVITVYLVYLITKDQFNENSAILATAFMAFSPIMIEVSRSAALDAPQQMFICLFMYLLLKKKLLLSSAVLGFAAGIKLSGFFLVPILLLHVKKENRLKTFIYFMAGFLMFNFGALIHTVTLSYSLNIPYKVPALLKHTLSIFRILIIPESVPLSLTYLIEMFFIKHMIFLPLFLLTGLYLSKDTFKTHKELWMWLFLFFGIFSVFSIKYVRYIIPFSIPIYIIASYKLSDMKWIPVIGTSIFLIISILYSVFPDVYLFGHGFGYGNREAAGLSGQHSEIVGNYSEDYYVTYWEPQYVNRTLVETLYYRNIPHWYVYENIEET